MSEEAESARQQRFIGRFMENVPHLKQLGISYVAHGPGWAQLEMPYAPHLVAYPDNGVVASGAIFTLMDSTAGFSVFTAQTHWAPHATLDLRLDYLRPAEPGKTVTGRAEVTKIGRSVAFVRGIAHDGDPDHPIARMTGTFMFTAGSKA